jgi:hypothetical protein
MPRRFAFLLTAPYNNTQFGGFYVAQYPASNVMLPPLPVQGVTLAPPLGTSLATAGTLLGAPSDSPARLLVWTRPTSAIPLPTPATGSFAIAYHPGMPRVPGTDIYLAGHFEARMVSRGRLQIFKLEEGAAHAAARAAWASAPQEEAPRVPRYEAAPRFRKTRGRRRGTFRRDKGRYGQAAAASLPLVPVALSAVVGWVVGRRY